MDWDSEYNLTNSHYENPSCEIYFMNVPFGSDYKNVVDFPSRDKQIAAFKAIAKKHLTGVNIIRKNGALAVQGKLGDFEEFNYCMYRNTSVSDKWWFAFIVSPAYTAKNTTTVLLQTDVWQSYLFDRKLYRGYLARGHVKKSDDIIGKWLAPESIGFPADVEVDKNAFSDFDFTPSLVMDAVTRTTTQSPPQRYIYGGAGSGQNMTGTFRFTIDTAYDDINEIIASWSLGEADKTTINHLNDLIGFSFLPKWVVSATPKSTFMFSSEYFTSNALVSKSDTVSLSKNTLASGYKPKNNKMFTSLAKAYKIWNKNGLSIPLKPELLESMDSVTLTLSMRPMGATYKCQIVGYKDKSTQYFDAQYSYNISIGFNSNVGTAQATALQELKNQSAIISTQQVTNGINTAMSLVNGAVGVGVNIASGNSAGAIMGGLNTAVNAATSIENQRVNNAQQNFKQDVAVNDAYASITKSIGNNSDRTTMTNDFCKIRLADCSPLYDECEIIDDFLTTYGYSIQKIENIASWTNTRDVWNFIQTNGVNLKINGCASDESQLRSIFDAGTTIWHGLDNYGHYEKNNS